VWVETPSNPGLDVCDVAAVAAAARAAGALLAVDNTLATPLGQRPLDLGADVSMAAATKALSGHSDLLLGYLAVRDEGLLDELREWRGQTGAIAGPFEAWLAHRSLATADVRLERQSHNAQAIAERLRERDDVTDVRHPSFHPLAHRQMRRFGPLVGFALPDAEAAQRFLGAARLIAEATSFGGVHTTGERRARWGTDAVSDGFVRLSAGVEDTADLLDDVRRALDSVH
jgi:cystathionine gamma-lyase